MQCCGYFGRGSCQACGPAQAPTSTRSSADSGLQGPPGSPCIAGSRQRLASLPHGHCELGTQPLWLLLRPLWLQLLVCSVPGAAALCGGAQAARVTCLGGSHCQHQGPARQAPRALAQALPAVWAAGVAGEGKQGGGAEGLQEGEGRGAPPPASLQSPASPRWARGPPAVPAPGSTPAARHAACPADAAGLLESPVPCSCNCTVAGVEALVAGAAGDVGNGIPSAQRCCRLLHAAMPLAPGREGRASVGLP